MTSVLVLTALISSGLIYTLFHPILLPPTAVSAVETFLNSIWWLDGFIPINAIVNMAYIIFWLLIGKLMFKLIMGLIALVSGGGKPEID